MGKKNLTRRQFMSTIAAGAGTVLIGNVINAIPVGTDRKCLIRSRP